MMQAMQQMQSSGDQFCSKCAAVEQKASVEARTLCEEIQHLRGAGQKMIDQLAAYMSRESLQEFVSVLRLDKRVFSTPGEFDLHRDPPFPVEAQVSRKDVEWVTAERDIAKMKLATVGKELQALREEREQLQKQIVGSARAVDSDGSSDSDSRLAAAEARLEALETAAAWARARGNVPARSPSPPADLSACEEDCQAVPPAKPLSAAEKAKLSAASRMAKVEARLRALEQPAPRSEPAASPPAGAAPVPPRATVSTPTRNRSSARGPDLHSSRSPAESLYGSGYNSQGIRSPAALGAGSAKQALAATRFPYNPGSSQEACLRKGRSGSLVTFRGHDLPSGTK